VSRAVRDGRVLIRFVAVAALVIGAVVAVSASGDSSTSAATTESFVPLTPARVLDTRGGAKVGNAAGTAAPYVLQVTGQGGVPASGVGAVALNVTVTLTEDPTIGGGYVTVFPCGTRPDASNLNFVGGQTIPNSVIAPVSASGEVCFYVYGTAHLIADVSGYFPTGSPPAPPTTTTAPTTTTSTTTPGVVGPWTVDVTSSGAGSVLVSPDQLEYVDGSVVELTATPDTGWSFAGWSGDQSGSENPLAFTITSNTSVTATFTETVGQAGSLVTNVVGPGSIVADPDLSTYQVGDEVTLTAIADAGAVFTGWSGDVSGSSNPILVTVGVATTVTATFQSVSGAPLIDVWNGLDQSFGQLGIPQVAVNVLGNVSDPDGVASIRYSLNGAPNVTLRMGPDSRRLAKLGDFNVELPVTGLNDGANTLRLTATDSGGAVSVVDVDVDFAAGNVWPTPYSVDWSTASEIDDVAQIVDGKWTLENGGVRSVEPAYDRIIAIGDVSWTDYEVTVPVTINGFDESGFSSPVSGRGAGLGLLVRWAGATDKPVVTAEPKSGWLPHGAIGWWWWESPTSARLELTANGSRLGRTAYGTPPAVGSTLMYKMRVETDPVGVTDYSLKVWPSTESEPATWNFSGSDKPGDPQTGSIVLLAHHVDATYGDVTVTPLGTNPSGFAVDVSTSGSGVVSVSPDRQQYAYGDDVTLTATPDAGWVFTGWSGDITSTVNPLVVSMTSSVAVTANFVSESAAPVISNIVVTPYGESATVTWTTDKQTTGSLAYGTTAAYELGSVESATLSTSHSVNISGLSSATTYHFRITADDQSGNVSQTADATFTTRNAGLSGFVSDDFNACAVDDAVWSFVDPVGDGSVTVNGTQLELSVPGGVSHDVWTGGNFAPRLMQPLNDVDVELAAKFDSTVFDAFESQGWIVEQDAQNFLRFDVYGTGTGQNLFVAKFVNGSPQALVNTSVAAPGPVWLRVGRVGDVWTLAWSVDGVSWTTAARFVHAMSVTQAGVFAGNAGSNPAHTAVIDYVFDTATPILDEDADTITCIGGVSVERLEDSAVVS
jgi:hypothetical protein